MRKRLTTLAVTGLMLASSIPPARAVLVVTDPGNTYQNILQVGNQVKSLANDATAIANQVQQINAVIQQLKLLASGDFTAIVGLAAQQNADLAELLTTATTLQYSLASVQTQINAAFPQGAAQWAAIPDLNTGAVLTQQRRWDALITEAGATAARAQTSLNRIQNRNVTLTNLMTAASAEAGDVRQAQIGNQISGTLAQGVNDLIAVQTTANRLATIQAQTAVAQRALAQEQNRRSMVGFGDPGPAAVPLGALPPVQ